MRSTMIGNRLRNNIRLNSKINSKYLSSSSSSENNYLQLVFLRHGQSTWNQKNIFIGMTDTPLTEDGILEARAAGRLLAVEGIQFDLVYTSLLRRSTKTVWLVMQELALEWVPIVKDWRLNERNYGALVGLHKKECVEEYGKDQVKRWRRSWDEPPPAMTKDYKYWPGHDYRYEMLGINVDEIPLAESLKEVTERTSKFWDEEIAPQLRKQKKLLIVGHENNLRSIIKRLDNISNDDIINLELPRAIPLLYYLDPITLEPIKQPDSAKMLSGKYLSDKKSLEKIAERDHKQVYDLNVKENLETGPKWDSWRKWMVFLMGPSYGSPSKK
eukprot:gene9679-20124_t